MMPENPDLTVNNSAATSQQSSAGTGQSNGRIPNSNNDRESEVSWFEWVLFGASSEQRTIRKNASNLVKQLNQFADRLTNAKSDADAAIRNAIGRFRDENYKAMLKEMPVDRLKDVATSIRVGILKQHGYRYIVDLVGVSSARLQQLSGIGPATAPQIVRAVQQICESLRRQSFVIPLPDDVEISHSAILRAAYTRIRCRGISRDQIEALRAAASFLRGSINDVKAAGPIWARLIQRTATLPKVAAAFERLNVMVGHDEYRIVLNEAAQSVQRLEPPLDWDALRNEYRDRFAEYSAVLEAGLEGRHVDDATSAPAQQGRHGSVPAQIAERVEAVVLSLDSLDVDLRGYQEFGAKYLVHQKRTVLGDEMGLGKTIQALAAMTHLHNVEDANWFMVVCPASIIGNWSREIEKRSKFSARILHGAQRQDQLHRWMTSGGVAVTSFETLRAMIDQINMPIHLLIADEAHYLKNRATKRNANIRQLAQLSDRIALMTGTALENHPKEFAELVRICDHQLGSNLANAVTNSLGLPGMARRFETLVAPAYLRRNQTDVLRELPECIEIEEWITLSDPELRHYANQVHSRNAMAMRQAANGGAGGNAKLERLSELVDEYRDAGRKLVIFSFFRNTLDAIGDLLGAHHRIDGSVPAIRRSAIIDQFTNAKGFAAMVCQIEAGGVGINLQSASVVVLFEPQYKPTTEWQAIKRAHRMGQTNRVIVHRFLARETIDESLRQLVAKKAAIFDDYARNSAVKDASPAAVDTSETQITQQLVEMELRRIGAA